MVLSNSNYNWELFILLGGFEGADFLLWAPESYSPIVSEGSMYFEGKDWVLLAPTGILTVVLKALTCRTDKGQGPWKLGEKRAQKSRFDSTRQMVFNDWIGFSGSLLAGSEIASKSRILRLGARTFLCRLSLLSIRLPTLLNSWTPRRRASDKQSETQQMGPVSNC